VENGLPVGLLPGALPARNAPLTRAQPTSAQGNGRTPLAMSGAPWERAVITQATVEMRAALEDAVVAATTAAQRARSLTVVLEQALAALAMAETGQAVGLTLAGEEAERAELLSPREREVLALVAEGRSNKAIAEALFVSPNTVKTHVASLLHKLDADTRAQLAVIATRHAPSITAPDALPVAPGSARISPIKTVGIAQLGG
jgi:DNA-binding CsgD family transcriptional regulator